MRKLCSLMIGVLLSSPGALAVADVPAAAIASAAAPVAPAAAPGALVTEPAPRSVYEISPLSDGAIIAVGGISVLLPYLNSGSLVTRRCPCDPNEVNPIDRGVIGNSNDFLDSASDVTLGLAIAAPAAWSLNELGWSQALLEDLVVYSQVLAVNGALVTIAKYSTQRPLPRTYAQPTPELAAGAGGFRSFYSGHVSTTFALLSAGAMTYRYRYGPSVWPWLVTAGVGATVMVERVAAGRHFYSDVLFGSIAGLGVGTLIPMLHRKSSESQHAFRPIATTGRLGLEWSLKF